LSVPADPLVSNSIVAELSTRLKGADSLASSCREELSQLRILPAALLRTAFCVET
jgi:hypothetical protein